VNLKAFTRRFLRIWRRRLRVGDDVVGALGRNPHGVVQPLGVGHGLELLEQGPPEAGDGDVLQVHDAGPRLHLGEVEDAVEQAEQVVARRPDDAGVLHLHVGHVAVRVLLQLLGEDEEAVERRRELVDMLAMNSDL
jgi:hypothetical protein